jgi:glycosyltransferase involved in cell wall biosynthesis
MPDRDSTHDDLKLELDALRLESQELHAELQRFEQPSFLLRKLAAHVRRVVRARVHRTAREAASTEAGSPIRPYVVRRPETPARDRPRVVHAIGNFYTGGSPRLVVDLVERLGDLFEQRAVVRDLPRQPHYVGLELDSARGLGSTRDAMALLRRLRPDLLHIHFLGHHRHSYARADWRWYDALFRAAEELGCPVVENVNVPVAPYFSGAVRRYVFVSDYVRDLYGRTGDPNVTIYPGSNFELFSRRIDRAPPADCVGMVYRLEGDKLDESAIDVFIEVLQRRPGTKALIVGGGRFLEPYRNRVAAAGLDGATVFTGYVPYDALPELYEQMTVFVAPPHRESFGHVVPLAMNMEIPVAAYAVGALPEILDADGTLATPGDVDALASNVVGLLDDPDRRHRIGRANRERAQQLFSVERMVGEYRALYLELLA